jgi:hypothetical protein
LIWVISPAVKTAGADFQAAPDVTLAAGQPLSANIPGAGVITIYRK